MTVLLVLAALICWEAYRTLRGLGSPGTGLASALVTALVGLLLANGVDWSGRGLFWLWPVLALLAAVTVGLRATQVAGTTAGRSPEAGRTAPR